MSVDEKKDDVGVRAIPVTDTRDNADINALAGLGYKQEFKRDLGFFQTFSVSFSVVGILPSVATTLYYAIGLAGRAGMTWGYLLGYTGIHAVALCMAELASAYPTSGGNYYVTAVIAPPKIANYLTWIVGWSNWIGLVMGCPSVNYGNASMIAALLQFRDATYVDTQPKRFAMAFALTFGCACMAALPTRLMGHANTFGTYLQMSGMLIILIGVPVAAFNRPRFVSAEVAWSELTNGTEWPDGIAILLSFLTAIWTMSGYDAPFHMSEETVNAQVQVPRAIAATSTIGGITGWALLLVVAYTATDTVAIGSSIQPWIAWLFQVTPPNVATAFGAITIICGFMCAQGCAITASRLAYAYSRDGVLPFSHWTKRMNSYTYTPVNAVLFNLVVQTCTLCLIFAGGVAINAVFSITATGMYFSFITPIFIKLVCPGNRWTPGPWTLGRFSKPLAAYACAWVALMIPILSLPVVKGADLNPQTMNWTCVVWGGPMFMATIWYIVSARKTFTGPKMNIDHVNLPDGTTLTPDQMRDLKLADVRNIQLVASRSHEA